MTCVAIALLVSLAMSFAAHGQDSTTSFDGPPKEIDENATPEGVGFNQAGGELSATALEQAAIGNPTVHYHYYSAPPARPDSDGASQPAAAPALPPDAAPSTEPGYAPSTMVVPLANPTNAPNSSWHLYQGNIGGFGAVSSGHALGGYSRAGFGGGSSNFYIPNGVSGYRPSIDNAAFGSGAFVGNWDPYANGGTGSIQGFD